MKINNLGLVKSADISLKKIAIFTGKNNTGKTYTSYMLYGILSYLKDMEFEFVEDRDIQDLFHSSEPLGTNTITLNLDINVVKSILIDTVSKNLQKNLKKIALDTFKLKETEFKDLEIDLSENEILNFFRFDNHENIPIKKFSFGDSLNIQISYSPQNIHIEISYNNELDTKEMATLSALIINKEILNTPKQIFYIPAERTGINVFKNELNESRLKTYDTMMNTIQYASLKNKKSKSTLEKKLFKENLDLFLGVAKSSYPKPISDYINYLNDINNKPNFETVGNTQTPAEYIRTEILNGKYEIDDDDNSVFFRHRYGQKMFRSRVTPFHVASSSIKSLFGLDYFLDHIGSQGDYLIIDEPELSLHYDNQKKLASFFFELIKSGYKIILSTHSDILIRELTNIVLKNKLDDVTDFEQDIKIYNFEKGYTSDLGELTKINSYENFDNTSADIDDRYSELLFLLRKKNERQN